MIVYKNGKPLKSAYKKFKIKGFEGQDDFASMAEVLTRRFEEYYKSDNSDEGFGKLPDLILLDGGKGQIGAVKEVLINMNIDVPLLGMVKDDKHRTRGLYYENKEINFPPKSEAFLLLTRIQDEAHRFAIEYHRSLRSKSQVHSVLDEIEGVGPARRKALMRRFESIENIRNASLEELAQTESFNKRAAQQVYDFLHKTEL